MKAKQQLEQSVRGQQIREALNTHWHASAAGDLETEHDIYDDDAICDYPQSGERILGRSNLQALRSHHPGKPLCLGRPHLIILKALIMQVDSSIRRGLRHAPQRVHFVDSMAATISHMLPAIFAY